MAEGKLVKMKALTPIWTGDANGQGDRLITTGLLGSIRSWFEVLARGVGGWACDPSDGDTRCPDKQGRRCVVCELFGCTGWARKFRFQVVDSSGNAINEAIKNGRVFTLRFTPLRPITTEEWALLDLTLRLISDFSAIGGATVFKPSDETARVNAQHHRDYGLVKIESTQLSRPLPRQQLQHYVGNVRQWRQLNHGDFAWASLRNFWCVKGRYLTRQNANTSTFNRVLGRNESKTCQDCGKVHDPPQRCPKTGKHPRRLSERLVSNNQVDRWLAGHQQESKKIFSFKDPPRSFGFVNPGTVEVEEIKRRLRAVWAEFKDNEFLQGPAILDQLFGTQGNTL